MKIVHLNLMNTGYSSYLPLFVYKDYIYLIRRNFKQGIFECKDGEYESIYDGLFKYNLINNLIEPIFTSRKIVDYFFGNNLSILYYTAIEERECESYITFFSLDNDTEVEKKLFSVKLQNNRKNSVELSNNENSSGLDVISQLVPFALNENYVCYKIDKISELKGEYNQLDDSNEFQLFIYDLFEKRSYQILDKEFCKHGFECVKLCEINGEEHIIFNVGLYEERDKYEYMFNRSTDISYSVRGEVDAIYTIPLRLLIDEVKQNKQRISYKEIQSIGQEGTIRLIKVNGSQIYYRVNHFDNNTSQFVMCDIRIQDYNRREVKFLTNLLGVTSDGSIGYVYDDECKCILELSGDSWDCTRELRVSGRFIGTIEPSYLIMEEAEIIENGLVYFSNIYDVRTLKLINRIKGQPFVFDKNDMVIIC